MAKKNLSKLFKKLNYEPIIHILSIVIVILFIINLFFVTSLTSSLKQKFIESEELAKPAKLELTVINADCDNCFDINTIVSTIKAENVNITNEQTLSADNAQELIAQYNIKKLPTVIVKGELNKTNLKSTLTATNDALIFTNQTPPYFDTESNKVKGLVVATIINPENCENCTSVEVIVDSLKQSNIAITRVITLNESQAQDLIETYNILKLPSLILSSDALEYNIIKENWPAVGTEESDGNLILRNINPPYKNLATGKIDGLVTLTFVNDSLCTDCYDVTSHKTIINNYGVVIVNERTVDVNTPAGQALVQSYNITLVPTIVLSSDVKLYTGFASVLLQVGEEAENGDLVFTAVQLMGKHKNLETGEIIEGQQ